MDEEYLSARFEPALGGGNCEADPLEKRPDGSSVGDEDARACNSVMNEPAMGAADREEKYIEYVREKRAKCSTAGNMGVTLLASLLGGPTALLASFLAAFSGTFGSLYFFVGAPLIEEIAKQAAMLYLLERRPWRVFSKWQFFFAASVSALIFATVENYVYLNFYFPAEKVWDPAAFADYRWTVCTLLHISCSLIAAMGMVRIWEQNRDRGKIGELKAGLPLFIIAVAAHGVYNFIAFLLDDIFIKPVQG